MPALNYQSSHLNKSGSEQSKCQHLIFNHKNGSLQYFFYIIFYWGAYASDWRYVFIGSYLNQPRISGIFTLLCSPAN
jgi:hypothetical protein